MSNNIYDILKKIENLEAPRQSLTEGKKAKPDYIDIDRDGDKKEPMKKAVKDKSKGAVAEAVAQVEKQLNERYMSFKQAADKKLGEDYQSDMKARDKASRAAEFEKDLEFVQSGGAHRDTSGVEYDRFGNPAFDVKTRNKLEKNRTYPVYRHPGIGDGMPDRPVSDKMDEDAVEESGLQAYLGKKKYGEQGMRALQKAGRDGASKEKMAKIRARHDKMDEDAYNEDMLSPKQKKIASMAGDPDKIDAKDFAALRGEKKGKNKVGGKEYKVQEDGDFDDKGNRQLSSDEAKRVYNHPKYDPNRSANAQYSDHFDDRGYERLSHDQAVEVGKHPKYDPNLPANAQGHLLSKQSDMKSVKEARSSMREGWEEMQKYLEKKRGPESKGGEGKKAGTRYGGSAQKDDDDEELDGEGKPAVKKKGRPKGTGGGAKFNFKKPKD